MTQKVLAFVARSFDPQDEDKIEPILKSVDSFRMLGFIAQSAERSEVESVSEKVRTLIDKSDVLIGILTKRHPVYRLDGRWRTAWNSISGKLAPAVWTAPPWVLQESGYALRANKALILFRELDVEIPGLQGDLEYIPFDPRNPTPALQRASEMITSLIAKAGGIKIETVVQVETIEPKQTEVAQPPESSSKEMRPDDPSEDEVDFRTRLVNLWKLTDSRDWEASEREYSGGLKWIRERKPEDEVFWKSFYQRRLFVQGRAEALTELRALVNEYKSELLPREHLAASLRELREYDEAVKFYLDAGAIASGERRASLEITAAETLRDAKKPNEAKEILSKLREADYAKDPKTQFEVLRSLYVLSKESDDKFASFAIAELALHQRPEQASFRFSLAFDYSDAKQNHMSLYHYKIICDRDEENAGALNNLGIALANCELPVLAVRRYKESYKLGETLAASNLARKYSEAGLSDEAINLLKEAQTKENCVPEVSSALAAVHDKIEENSRDQERVITEAERHRDYFLGFAKGYFSLTPTNLDGRWTFPSGELELRLNRLELSGSREDRSSVSSPFTGLFETVPKTITRIEKSEFLGTLSGRTCKFKFEIKRREEPSGWSILGGPSDSKSEGYIVFAEDGKSGKAVELKAGKPENYYEISKTN